MKKIHGFQIKFKAPIQYVFTSQVERNKWVRLVRKQFTEMGIDPRDYEITLASGDGPRLYPIRRIIKGGKS